MLIRTWRIAEGAAAIVSAEARALGHRPPAGSLAAQAQSAADKHPVGGSFDPAASPVELAVLKDAATKEGERLREQEAGDGATEAQGAKVE